MTLELPVLTNGTYDVAPEPPLSESERETLHREIRQMAHERRAVILAHNYQVPEVQDVADFVGDSLGLAREAARTDAQVIAMCGVYFMAETAKILNMEKTVLMPDPTAGCSLADSITAEDVRTWKAQHPGAVVVSYVNTTAAVKAESDYCVTSGNAEAVVRSIPSWQKILFLPDFFLGTWLKQSLGRENMEIWLGECHVHAGIRPDELEANRKAHADADLLVHPECGCSSQYVYGKQAGMLAADSTYILSTEGMVTHAKRSPKELFLVATEVGILHRLEKEIPDKRFLAADRAAVCKYMKQITLRKLHQTLLEMSPSVEVEPEMADRARLSIDRMLAVTV
ncbi:MAG TPA: quinolinate synthase NadA [Chloroflexota bacterium]|nr:quinolinate synthase NadA [Chloroflexota bacterium]